MTQHKSSFEQQLLENEVQKWKIQTTKENYTLFLHTQKNLSTHPDFNSD